MRDLLSYRVSRLANTISRSAALRLRREFGLGLGEWRTIGLIGGGVTSPNEVARQANLDKGQVSRIVTALIGRGLIERKGHKSRGRMTQLDLTIEGRQLYERLMEAARQRDATLLAALSRAEERVIVDLIEKLQDVALVMLRAEKSLADSAEDDAL